MVLSELVDRTSLLADDIKEGASNENMYSHISYMQTQAYRLKLIKSKLKAVQRTSALLSGFAMIAMVELGLDYGTCETGASESSTGSVSYASNSTNAIIKGDAIAQSGRNKLPHFLLTIYAIVTCLLVGVHVLALMISTCILSQVEAIIVDVPYYATKASDARKIPALKVNEFNIEYQFHFYTEFAWLSSTVVGIFLFLVEVLIVCFIKFYPVSKLTIIAVIITMIPVLIIFVIFTFYFYKRITKNKLLVGRELLDHIESNFKRSQDKIV